MDTIYEHIMYDDDDDFLYARCWCYAAAGAGIYMLCERIIVSNCMNEILYMNGRGEERSVVRYDGDCWTAIVRAAVAWMGIYFVWMNFIIRNTAFLSYACGVYSEIDCRDNSQSNCVFNLIAILVFHVVPRNRCAHQTNHEPLIISLRGKGHSSVTR